MIFLPRHFQERIINKNQGSDLIKEGWEAADLHVHSSCSYDVIPAPGLHPEAIYQSALDKGMKFVTITDHDTMDAYDIIGWEREHLVTGVEISLKDPKRIGHTIHVNVYDLDRSQFDELENIVQKDQNLETFINYLTDQNLPYMYNHPFWFSPGDTPNYKAVDEIASFFPIIEHNMKRISKKNFLAMWLAVKYNKGILASTDTHIGQIAAAYSLSKGNTFREFYNTIAEGKSYIVPENLTLRNLNQEISGWLDILFDLENIAWEKSRFTGIHTVDAIINFLANNSCENYPYTFPILEAIARNITRTGFFSLLYISSQNQKAHKIRKLLNLPEFAFDSLKSF